MRKIREVLRLYLLLKLSGRQVAESVNLSPSTVSEYVTRAKLVNLGWPLPEELDSDEALEKLLFRDHQPAIARRPEPDWSRVHLELRSRKGVTKLLVWQEFREQQPEGLGYSQFCERYSEWSRRLNVTMRQTHRVGEKMFVDFSGDGLPVVDVETGERRTAKLFVAVLGASNLTYVEPVFGEDLATWIGCHIRALEYFGGSTEIVVPDNLRSGVKHADRYEPELNPTYAEFAAHYGLAIIPARVRRPRDKAKVEQGVLLAERWVLAVLRHHHFSSLQGLREAVRPLLEKLNGRKMRRIGKSRRELFEEIERPALRPLPTDTFEMTAWAKATVRPDYHVEHENHFYSVQHTLVDEVVEVRTTEKMIEILHGGLRIASHARSLVAGGQTTLSAHMPRAHREQAELSPERVQAVAAGIGANTSELVKRIFETRQHPLQGLQSSLGVVRLSKEYPPERLERACARALSARTYSRKSVLGILRAGLDAIEVESKPTAALPTHANVRGAQYYN